MVSAGLQINSGRAVARFATPRLTVSVVPAGGKPVLLRPRARFAHTGSMGLFKDLFAGSKGRVAGGKVLASGERQWDVVVTSTAVVDEDTGAGLGFQIQVLDQASDAHSEPISLEAALPWDRKPKPGLDGLIKGWARKGQVALPAAVGVPGAVLVTKKARAVGGKAEPALDFISTISFKSGDQELIFPVHSWISSDHGTRVFFQGAAYLPKDCPPRLAAARQAELDALKGTGGGAKKRSDRVYGWQVYDDLDKVAYVKGDPKLKRPTLGGSKELPYPRHLANLKAEGETGCGTPWVPFDEEFGFLKEQGFKGDALLGKVSALVGLLSAKLELRDTFQNFGDVYEIFAPNAGWDQTLDEKEYLEVVGAPPKSAGIGGAAAAQTDPRLLSVGGYMVGKAIEHLKKGINEKCLSIKFDEPRVMKGRREAWDTDEEMGRQFVAGLNPCTLVALKELPSQRGSAIGPEHVDAELKSLGAPGLAELAAQAAGGAKPRLFLSDYWFLNYFWGEKPQDTANRAEHLGRALIFLKQDKEGRDEALIPLAIELASRDTYAKYPQLPKTAGLVYSRQELAHDPNKARLWRLAKAVFKSLDLSQHQLISHWLRCHACIEPFIIAMHRNISAMHPVYKLMSPHFRYTLDINSRGRVILANSGGFIESAFTPGEYNMRLTAVAYSSWRFRAQALPTDLQDRGLLDAQGKLYMDYPYAEDGLDIWEALAGYFKEYLGLYYKADADVAGDAELQAWWDESKRVGHEDTQFFEPDEEKVWGFAGPIASLPQLVHVLTTIAWTASAHHTAVNFSQYDYSGLLLNASCQMRRPIPDPKDTTSPAYQALVHAPTDSKLQAEHLSYLGDQKVTLKNCVTMSVLSTHSEDEQFLDQPNELVTDPAARALNEAFIQRMKALEGAIAARNKDPSKWTRGAGRTKGSLEYNQLIPGSAPGLTGRGVPYSVSI